MYTKSRPDTYRT